MNAKLIATHTDRSHARDRSIEDELMRIERLDAAERGEVRGLALRAMNRLGQVLTKRGTAIVYGERNAHPFAERLSIEKLFALDTELLAALLRPYRRKNAPIVNLPLVACNARRSYVLVNEQRAREEADTDTLSAVRRAEYYDQADADGIVRRTYRPVGHRCPLCAGALEPEIKDCDLFGGHLLGSELGCATTSRRSKNERRHLYGSRAGVRMSVSRVRVVHLEIDDDGFETTWMSTGRLPYGHTASRSISSPPIVPAGDIMDIIWSAPGNPNTAQGRETRNSSSIVISVDEAWQRNLMAQGRQGLMSVADAKAQLPTSRPARRAWLQYRAKEIADAALVTVRIKHFDGEVETITPSG